MALYCALHITNTQICAWLFALLFFLALVYLFFCGWKEYDIDGFKILKSMCYFFFFNQLVSTTKLNLQTTLWTYSASIHIYVCLYLKLSEATIFFQSLHLIRNFSSGKRKRGLKIIFRTVFRNGKGDTVVTATEWLKWWILDTKLSRERD